MNTITVFVIKHWQSNGILEKEVVLCGEKMCKTLGAFANYFHKGEFFYTKEEAISACEIKRKKKLALLKKQYDKIEKMIFQ